MNSELISPYETKHHLKHHLRCHILWFTMDVFVHVGNKG